MAYKLYYGSNALFDPYTDNTVYDAKLTAKANTSDYLDFTVPYGHDLYDSLEVKAETVKLYWDKDCLYVGTIESIETDIQGNLGITCTGALDWLADSVVRPYSTVEGEQPLTAPSSVDGLFGWYIDQHNEHCLDTRKQFSVGENQGALLDDNNYVYRSNESTPTTLDEVQGKIIDELGGYLFVDYEPLTIDLYADVHTTNAQVIDFGVNITDFTSTTDTSDQYTAIRPEGATPESDGDSDEEQRPITIEGLADGGVEGYSDLWKVGDVVYSVSGVARYGYREYAYSNTDCTTEQGLLTSACKKLNAILSPDLSITVKAVDLSLLMEGYTHLKVGEAVRVRSKFHGIDEYLMVQSIELDLQDPSQSTYELGAEYSTLTGQQSTYLKNLNSNINTALDATSALSDETKAAASEAKDAKTQAAEAKAAADAAVVSNVAQWATTADPATKPAEGDWSADAPDYEAGRYIWLRNVITYGSGDTSTTDGVCITGNTGKGVKGDNAYVHIAYANSEDGKTDFSVDDPVGKSYIGQYSDNEEDDSTDPTKYAWTKIKGEQGKQGEKGDQGEQGIQGEKGDQGIQGEKGAKGDKGDDGTSVTVKSTSTQYASSTSGTDTPSSWQDTIPSVAAGSYLWTKTTVVYSDGNSTSTYTVALQGKTGAKGDTGAAGASKFTWIKYADSPTSGMSDSPDGKAYMGVAYNKDTATESTAYGDYSWSLIKGETGATGAKGDKGDTGATGATGAKGDTGATGNGIKSMSYAYKATTTQTQPAASEITATTIPTLSATNKYLWQKETVTFTSGSTQTNIALVGTYGDTGAKGDKGEQGKQGVSPTVTTSKSDGTTIIKITDADGTKTAAISDGADGNGIKSVTEHYQVSTSNTTAPTSWQDTVPTMTATNKYLWNYETIAYTDGTTSDSKKRVIGAYGTKGDSGKGVASIVEQYYQSTSATAQTGGSWSGTYPGWADGKYIWTRSVITYTDGTTTTTTPVCVTGSKGGSGDKGTSITSVDVQYYQSTSATSLSGGSWSTTAPTWADGKYIWTKTVTTYSTGSTSESNPACITGQKGSNGATGTSVSSIVNHYLATSASSGVTTSTSGWTTTVQAVSADKKYLWNYETVNYKDPASSADTTPCIIGAYGDKGDSVTKVAVTYGLSTSNASDGYSSVTSWTTDIPDWTSGKYIWQKSVTTIGTTSQAPVYALYGAFNSLASTVDGHTTQIKQQGDSIALKANSTDVAEISPNWIKDPSFANGSANTDRWSGSHTWSTDGMICSERDSYVDSYSIDKAKRVYAGQKLYMTLTADMSGLTDGTSCNLGFRIANADKEWEGWPTPLRGGSTTRGTNETISMTYAVPSDYDGYYFLPFIQLAATTTTTATGTAVIKHVQITDVTGANSYTDAQIKVSADSITSTVASTYETKSDAASIKTTAETAASDASAAKTTAATAASDASTAKSNAATAVTTANSANSTASTAKTTAETAASDASTAKTNASTALTTANTASSNASTALTTASTASSKVTQTATALGLTFNDSGSTTGTLINADSTGIEVGYSSDGSSFASTHTKMGTDAFSIHDKSHNELASFGTNTIELGKNSTDGSIRLCGGRGLINSKLGYIQYRSQEGEGCYGSSSAYGDETAGYANLEAYTSESKYPIASVEVTARPTSSLYSQKSLVTVRADDAYFLTQDSKAASVHIYEINKNDESFDLLKIYSPTIVSGGNFTATGNVTLGGSGKTITLNGKFTPPRPKFLWYNQATNVDAYDSMNNSSGTWADFYMFVRCQSNYDASSSAAYGYKVTDLLAHTDYYTLTTKTAGWWLLTFQAGVSNAGTAAADRIGCGIFIGGKETASCFEQAYNDGGSQHHPMARTMVYIKSGTTIKARMYASYYGKMYTHSRFTRFEMEFLGGDSHELGPNW